MKSIFTKKIAVFLLAALTASLLASCSDAGSVQSVSDSAETAAAETEAAETRIYPDLPAADFEGYTFNMCHWTIDGWTIISDLCSESLNGEVLNDAIYSRNAAVEEKYNVKISAEYVDVAQYVNTVRKLVQAGDNAYDVFLPRSYEMQQLVNGDVLYDMATLPHVDFTKPWWDAQSVDELTMLGHIYAVESDITLTDKAATACIYFSKRVAENYNLGNIYELVSGNKWTLDKMKELGLAVVSDLNGDGTMNGFDRWGIVSYDDWTYIILHGSNGRYVSKDEDGIPVIAFGNERTIGVAQKIVEMMYDKSYFLHTNDMAGTNLQIVDLLSNDQFLFYVERINVTETFRAVDNDFGILPVPKFEESQEKYGNSVSIHTSSILTIPKTIENPERTGIILEALASESRYTVIPAYYDIVLKDKYSRDQESVEMLDIIFSTRVYDLGEFFQLGGFNETFLRMYTNHKQDVVSLYTAAEAKMQSAIEKFITTVEKNG